MSSSQPTQLIRYRGVLGSSGFCIRSGSDKPALADVNALFGHNMKYAGFLRFARASDLYYDFIPLVQGQSAEAGGAIAKSINDKSPPSSLINFGSGAGPNHSGGGNNQGDKASLHGNAQELPLAAMPVEVQNIRTRTEFEALQKRLGTYSAVQPRPWA